ncbi:MAG: hypothetical protein K0R39_4807 [Symbiobacteriaceae bacterium]|nr:hypothetical protein [Symbiobacteriaceae bacterium]
MFARMSGGRLPYFLLYLSAGLLLLTFFWARHALRRTECMVLVESDRMEVGQSLAVKVRMDNDTFLPLPWVEVDDATPQHLVVTDMPRQATSVPLWGSRMLTFKLTAKRRGHYTVGPIRVTLGDAFGLFQGRREFRSKASVTVYPRVHRIEGLPVPLSQPFGPVRTREKAFEDPSNQAEIREYRAGDNPRHIHWKTSARKGELMLREYELNATTHMMIFPDLCFHAQVRDMARELSTEECAVEIAASLAELGLRRKIDTGLICHGQERFTVASGRGQRTFHEILEVLARVEAQGKLPIEQVLELEAAHLSARSTLVVVTARLTARLAEILIRLRSNHQVMLVLLDGDSFAPAAEAQAPAATEAAATAEPHTERAALTGLLAMRRVSVYLVSSKDDLRRLADLRLSAASEGVRSWSQGARA